MMRATTEERKKCKRDLSERLRMAMVRAIDYERAVAVSSSEHRTIRSIVTKLVKRVCKRP